MQWIPRQSIEWNWLVPGMVRWIPFLQRKIHWSYQKEVQMQHSVIFRNISARRRTSKSVSGMRRPDLDLFTLTGMRMWQKQMRTSKNWPAWMKTEAKHGITVTVQFWHRADQNSILKTILTGAVSSGSSCRHQNWIMSVRRWSRRLMRTMIFTTPSPGIPVYPERITPIIRQHWPESMTVTVRSWSARTVLTQAVSRFASTEVTGTTKK